MPYEKSDEKLDSLIKTALEDPEILGGFNRARLDTSEVYAEVKKEPDQIWEAVTSEVTGYDEQEAKLQSAQREIERELGPPLTLPPDTQTWFVKFGALLVLLFLIALAISLYRQGWMASWNSLVGGYAVIWVVSAVGILAFSYLLEGRLRRSRTEKRLTRYQDNVSAWSEQKSALEERYSTKSLEDSVLSIEESIDKVLLERKIKPKLRELINNRLTESYVTTLGIKEARGLAEVFDPKMAIDTSARDSLLFMLKNMPGGSIGIAGPRGAGKTTLLRLVCGPKRIHTELNGKPVLAVLVSAPVAYQARDFILYLFSAVCQSLLEAEGGEYKQPALQQVQDVQTSFASPLLELLKPVPRVCISLGMLLVFLSLTLNLLLTAAAPPATPSEAAAAKPAVQTVSQPGAQPTIADQQGGSQPIPTQSVTPPPPQSALRKAVILFATSLKVLDLKLGTILTWGILLIVAGLIIGSLRGWKPVTLFLVTLVRMFAVIPPLRLVTNPIGAWLMRRADWERAHVLRDEMRRGVDNVQALQTSILAVDALDWLKRIKFQQSYTSGWSGALKLPMGLEGGVNNAVTLAENQLSLPEIVHFFTKMIDQTSLKYQVIIGIDELDKLESDEKAQRFLNDLKSIFGLERCFYLVSVSENAMANFERRGLPFRDVFDSSFDTILYVDYLSFESARTLLEQRVVGRPIPFFGLSYSLSGGLARDLIRTFRSIMEFRQANPTTNDLESICRAVVQADLKAKIRATAISVKKIDLEPEADDFLMTLYTLENEFASAAGLLKAGLKLVNRGAPEVQTNLDVEQAKEEQEKREKLSELGEELATYVYYATTILELFTNTLTKESLVAPEKGGSLDDLARARQVLGVNPNITRSLINTFRDAQGLTLPVWPVIQVGGK